MRSLHILMFVLAGCSGSAPNEGPTAPGTPPSTPWDVELTLPAIQGLQGDCEPPNVAAEISLPAWVGAANDVIEGTITDVFAAWDPLASSGGFLSDPSQCDQAFIGLDVVLTDAVSRRSGEELGDVTVRLGANTLDVWDVYGTAAPGVQQVTWGASGAPLVAGMRIGGAIYNHAHVDHPVFMTGFREPLYEVVSGVIHFQQQVSWECAWPTPEVQALAGLTPTELGDALSAAASEPGGDLAVAYREWLRVDDTSFDSNVSFTYTSYCSQLLESPNQDDEDDDPSPETPVEVGLTLPTIQGLGGDCEPPNVAAEISLPAWVGAANDVIEGTITDVFAAWDPLASSGGFLSDPSQCDQAFIGLDVVLTDAVSRRSGEELGDVTVRLGANTLDVWEVYGTAAPGVQQVTWGASGAPLVAGMRIGGAIYDHAHVDHPVFMTGFREPLYEVVSGVVHFQQQVSWECAWPTPEVQALAGLTPTELGDALSAAASEPGGDLAVAYREWLRVDDASFDSNVSFTYTSYCSQQAPFDDEPYLCQSDDDCSGGLVCLMDHCVVDDSP